MLKILIYVKSLGIYEKKRRRAQELHQNHQSAGNLDLSCFTRLPRAAIIRRGYGRVSRRAREFWENGHICVSFGRCRLLKNYESVECSARENYSPFWCFLGQPSWPLVLHRRRCTHAPASAATNMDRGLYGYSEKTANEAASQVLTVNIRVTADNGRTGVRL